MPLPTVKKDEKEDEFIGRCMGILKEEFPDNDQRLAVCYKQWEAKDKEEDSLGLKVDRRYFPPSLEIRSDDPKQPKLVGYAALFNVLSEPMYFGREKIAKGAFKKSIERDDVRMLWNHNSDYVLGRNKSGTLTLKEDEKGLYFEAIPPDTQWARDHLVTIKRGDVTQNSFGFIPLDDEEDEDENGKRIRTLTEVKLFDVSPVTYPAYLQTELHIRSKYGETVLIYDDMKDGPQKTIANIIRANEKVKVKENAYRYGVTDKIYSATAPNPTVILVDKPTGKVGEDNKAKPSFVVPKPDKPLIDPVRWARVSKYLK